MNLPLWPPQDRPASFWAVLAGMLVVACFLFVYFRRRKWL
jgi:LPXTG-motif cell wall-anchored protein